MNLDETDKWWERLNELQNQAQDSEPRILQRDIEKYPVTGEDHIALMAMIQEMTGQIARIEERLDVLYRMHRPAVTAADHINTWNTFAIAIAAWWAIEKVYHWISQ